MKEKGRALVHFHLQQAENAITSATRGMSSDHFKRHPEGKWSAAEIVEHLWLTYTLTTTAFDRCAQMEKPVTTPPGIEKRIYGFVVLKLNYFPTGRPAPPGTVPKGTPAETVLARIPRDVAAMDESIRKCEERFGSREKLVDHPILGPLTAAEWRKFHWLHARHHARQIERLKDGCLKK